MSWYKKLLPSRIRTARASRKVPQGLWTKCDSCSGVIYQPELERTLYVCSRCNNHIRVSARKRLDMFLDPQGRQEIGANISPTDFLGFKDKTRYRDRLAAAQKLTGEKDALVVIEGALTEVPLVAAAFEFNFIGGSMGSVVGERFRAGVECCLAREIPLVCFSTSGGARMQEALVSLFQMSKVSALLARLSDRGVPFVSVLTDPTMGGVSASLAMLGDVIIAEPRALIGFAGPRVIEQTVRQTLPEEFQRSEFLLEHGLIDMIVARPQLRPTISNVLSILTHRQT